MAQVCHRENSQNITARKFRSYIAFRIFVYSVIKKTGQPGPEKLRLNVRRFSVHASSYHHDQFTWQPGCYHHITFIFIATWHFQTFSPSTATHRKSCTFTLSPKERP
ncbi:hypothetical protein, partial [Escherichia coli]|uniref:hypothetical protein n=1 Tax=Escherichia coli TaxID=562 RepID=UPI001C407E08